MSNFESWFVRRTVERCVVPPMGLTVPCGSTQETRGAQNHVKVDLKPAMLENGLQVRVPGFINVDDEIMVDVRDHSFQGRAD